MKVIMMASALALASLPVMAQTPPPNAAGVSMGHMHLTVRNVEAQKKWWVDVLGATPVKIGNLEVLKFPGAIIFFRQGEPAGGSKGTLVDHFGFTVPDLKSFITRAKAAGARIVTETEANGAKPGDETLYIEALKTSISYVMAPDDVKVEVSEKKEQTVPMLFHHIHWFTTKPPEIQAFYAKHFGATPGMRGTFQAADVPGVNLTFSVATEARLPTKGRSVDHIGFEVKNLEAMCKQLEAAGIKFDVAFRKVPALGLAIAFFTDPWGTYVELTEGLNAL